jgi:hypothetical protein
MIDWRQDSILTDDPDDDPLDLIGKAGLNR